MKAKDLTIKQAVKMVVEELNKLGIKYYLNPDKNTIEEKNLQPLNLELNPDDLEGVDIYGESFSK